MLLKLTWRSCRLFVFLSFIFCVSLSTFVYAEAGPEESGMPAGPPPPMVEVIEAQRSEAGVSYEYVGQVSGSREVEIRARVTGIVEERLYEEGAFVEKDMVLFRLDDAPYKAALNLEKARVEQAKASLKQAEREYKRLKPLAKSEAVSQKEIDDALSAFELAQAALLAAEAQRDVAQINLEYTQVRAPISGKAGRALKMEGALVSAPMDTLLTTMAKVDPAYVNFSIPENDGLQLQDDLKAGRVMLPENGFVVRLKTAQGSMLPITGKMDFQDYKADTQTGSFDARATVDNPESLISPGQFVRVVLSGARLPDVMTVPQPAVQDGALGKYVYVVHETPQGTIALQKPVEVGTWVEGNRWVIRSGLEPGDKVIVQGMARLFFSGAPVQIAPEGGMPPGGMMPPPPTDDAADSMEQEKK